MRCRNFDTASVVGRQVTGEGAVAHRQHIIVVDAALDSSRVAGKGAVDHRHRIGVDEADVVVDAAASASSRVAGRCRSITVTRHYWYC